MDFEELASQLRKPEGSFGKELAGKMNITNDYINKRTIELLAVQGNEKVLEIGMGNGYLCGEILKVSHGISYAGCDFSTLMVEEASSNNKESMSAQRAGFYHANASNLPFGNDEFDKIFSVNTLYFWDDPIQELREIKRVLRPGKVFILSIRSRRSMENLPFVKHGFKLYDEKDLLKLLAEVGFSQVETLMEAEPEIRMEESMIKFESIFGVCAK